MITRLRWTIKKWMRRLWVRVTFIAMLGVASALAAQLLAPLVPSDVAWKMGAESVGEILTILASSLLAIATFSLATIISSYNAAASSTTPRITTLLRQDSSAQNALGTFVGGFLFSLAGIIGMGAGLYNQSGKLVLFIVTLFVVGWLVSTFLKWIHILPSLGRVEESISLITATAKEVMEKRYQNPFLGGQAAQGAAQGRYEVKANCSGYIAAIDAATLEASAQDMESPVYLTVSPGSWIYRGSTLLRVDVLQLAPVLEVLTALDWVGQINDVAASASDVPEPRYVLLADPDNTLLAPLVQRLLLERAQSLEPLWERAGLDGLRLADLLRGEAG